MKKLVPDQAVRGEVFMKWRGRPQSENIRDLRNETPHPVPGLRGSIDVTPTVGRVPKEPDNGMPKNPPLPTPRPKIKQTQVTPGKWKSK